MNSIAIQYVPTDALSARQQVRKHFDESLVTGLAVSLREVGMLQPIRARRDSDGNLVIIFGERRWLAAKKAGLKTVPVIIDEGPANDAATLCLQISENVQRADLSPIEKCDSITELKQITGWSTTQTGRKLGMSTSSITKLLSLRSLPESIKVQLAAGKISPSTAYEIARQDPEKQIELAERAAAGELKRDEVSSAAAKGQGGKAKRKRPRRLTASLSKGCSLTLSGAEWTLHSFASLCEELSGKAKAALAGGVALEAFLKSLKEQAKA